MIINRQLLLTYHRHYHVLEKLLNELVRQTQENAVLLRQALTELHELKQQVQCQRKIPFTVKTCGFEV